MSDTIQIVKKIIASAKESFEKIDNSGRFVSEANFVFQALSDNNYLLNIAMQNQESLKNAIINIASLKTTLNPADKKAYLVPRAKKVELTVSYIGLIDLAVTDNAILWAQSKLVYANDEFSIRGYDNAPIHKYNPFSRDRGDLVGVYCVAKYPNGDYITEAMTIDDINSIKARSKGNGKTPWDTDFTEMARKAVVKRAAKYWKGSKQLSTAIQYLNNDADEGIDFKENKPQSDITNLKRDLMKKLITLGIDKYTIPVFINQYSLDVNTEEGLNNLLENKNNKLISLVNEFLGKKKEITDESIKQKTKTIKPAEDLVNNLLDMMCENGISSKENQIRFSKFINCNMENEKHVRLWLNSADNMSKKALEFMADNLEHVPTLEEIENDETELKF
jgi:recombination protein RecT